MALPKPGSLEKRQLRDYAKEENAVPIFKDAQDRNWFRSGISPAKWDAQFPYQLRILKLVDGKYEPASVPGSTYTFPVGLEGLDVTTPFANATTITLGGSIEEHSGAPIRMLSLSGTFGVAPGRAPGADAKTINFAEAVFAGTISSFKNTLSSVKALGGDNGVGFNVHTKAEFADEAQLGKLTGYYQARVLQGFLEAYAELKKSALADARLYRLAFCAWKDEAVYLVTPNNLQIRKSASSPLEYLFSLSLKATKRVDLESVPAIETKYEPIQRKPSQLARLLQTAEDARRVLQGARKTILAVGGDFNTVVNGSLREITLFAKDALSVPLSLADLSDAVIQEAKRSILDLKSTGSAIANFPKNFETRFDQVSKSASEISVLLNSAAGEFGDAPELDISAHPAFAAFENPTENYDFFSSVNVGDLTLSPAIITKISEERDRVANMSRLEFKQRRDKIKDGIVAVSRALGLSSASYEATNGLDPLPSTAVDTPSEDDFEVLFSMNRLLQEMNRLVVTSTKKPSAILDTLSTVAGLAEQSGIAFRVPRSKFAVPFPYGSTLEMLSQRYLGTPDRWHEISALNGLQSPFVDEEGFSLPLLANGDENNIIIGDVTNLFVGKVVWIGSSFAVRTRRKVRKIEKLTPTQWMVTVDGDPDLAKYVTLAEAYLFSFLPNTVNSQQLIYIPSDTEPNGRDFRTAHVPGIDSQDPLIAVGGIDLLLTPQNDIVITKDGRTRWAAGLTNITQSLRLLFSTKVGSLNRHLDYGTPLEVGASLADIEISDIVRSIEGMVKNDSRYAGIEATRVLIQGPVTKLAVAVQIRGTQQVIPVGMDVAP